MARERDPQTKLDSGPIRARAWHGALFGLALAVGCTSPDPASSGDSDNDETATDTDTGASADDGGEYITCECVDIAQVCTGTVHQAAQGCYIDNPCGVVTAKEGNQDIAACVLQMLVDQVPGRFYYELADANEIETNKGWFYILGPGAGLETGCYVKAGGTAIPNANYYEIADGSYFEGCLGGADPLEMVNCLFDGLTLLEPFPQC